MRTSKSQFVLMMAAMLASLAAGALPLCAQEASQSAFPAAQGPAQTQASSPPQEPAEGTSSAKVEAPDPEAMFPHFKDTRFWLSGQTNFIFQTHPDFPALYSGPHSLGANYEKATSRVMTLYTGVRINNSTEILVDIEEAGGAALSQGFGLAGNSDLDIVRNPLLSKAPYLGRAMIHKVFALSKDQFENSRNFLSLFDELPRRRLEIRFGKFSMPDFLDQNSVGSDTHFQFDNWTIDNNGVWDYAADTRGYTVGFTADFEDHNWGFRFAEGLMPKVANGIDLVWKPWEAHGENFEYEWRHGLLPKKAGVIRALAFVNHANMGVYSHAVAQFQAGLVTAPDITNHAWHISEKYGFGANLEQNLMRDVTAFARWGWGNGKTESFAYTEVDSTVATGLGIFGSCWHRKKDRAGLAFVTNGIKKDHQVYLAEGGQGFLLGDGKLNYGREYIFESYYTAHIWRGIYAAPGVQHINNPGYNKDRGPVIVPTLRLHAEF